MIANFDRALVFLGFDKREVLSISGRGRLYFGITLLAVINLLLMGRSIVTLVY